MGSVNYLFTDGQAGVVGSPMLMGQGMMPGRQRVYYGGNVSMNSGSDHYSRISPGDGDVYAN